MPLNEPENGLPAAAKCERSPPFCFPRNCRHYLFTPRDDDGATPQKQQQERRQHVARGEGGGPNQPTNHAAIAGARQSLAIIQTSLGHSALRRAKEERPRGESAGTHDNNSTLR